MALNKALKMALLERELSQTELAKRTGIDESRLSRIVNGHVSPTRLEKVAIAAAIGLPTDDLFQAAA